MLRSLVVLLSLSNAISADLLRGVDVPEYAFAGSTIAIRCDYDLRQAQLYSLKWYHNKTEFYRYVPTERKRPINIRPTHKFSLYEISRTERQLVLNLSKLTAYASGEYRCEIIAEHPSFRTETLTATMTVLRDRFFPPVITDGKEIYEQSEVIKIGCQPRAPLKVGPKPKIVWYLDGKKAKSDYLSSYGYQAGVGVFGTYLTVPAKEVVIAGGTMKADCALILGNLRKQTSKILRVRRRVISYVNSYFSTMSYTSRWRICIPIFLLLYYKTFL